jgi:hypothetical protein
MIVAAVLGGLVALFAALLSAPLVLAVDAERLERFTYSWRVRGLFGLVDVRSGDRAREAAPPTASPPVRVPARQRVRRMRRRAPMAIAVLRTRGFVGRTARTAAAVSRRLTVHDFRLHTAFGFDDPADTGVTFGALSPLLVMARVRGLDLQCQPVFDEATWQGALHTSVRLRPIAVIGVLLAFVVSPPALRAARAAWRART